MDKDIENIFKLVPRATPPDFLYGYIFARIINHRKRIALYRSALWSATSLFSLISLYYIFKYTIFALKTSGFIKYLSLVYSDSGFVLANWNTYLLSLIESAPVLQLSLVFSASFVFFGSIIFVARQVNRVQLKVKFI